MVKLPKFEEFEKTLTPEVCDKISKDSAFDISELEERFKAEGYSVIPTAITERSFIMSLSLLNLYHEWLSEQLNKD